MPRLRELKTNFVAGELDDLLQSRSDIKHYFNGADYARNVVVIPQGGAKTRPGSRFLWEIPPLAGGGRSNVRLASFQFSTDQTYLFVFHHLKVTIFRDGAEVAELDTPYTSDNLVPHVTAKGDLIDAGISWTQSLDTMIVFHENVAPQKIMRTGSHSSWSIDDWELTNIPNRAFGGVVYVNGVNEVQEIEFPAPGAQGDWTAGDIFTLFLEDEETDNIKYFTSADSQAAAIQTALRDLPQVDGAALTVTHGGGGGATTPTVTFTVTFGGLDGQRPWGSMGYRVVSAQQVPTIDIFTATKGEYPGEPVWSDLRGWPRCGVFFQGRLWMAGSRSLPNTVWASRAGAPNDFNNKRLADDYAIEATSDTDDVPAFLNIYAGRHLQLFASSGEFYIPASESDAVTPANIVLRRTTSRGSRPGLRVIEVDGATLFVQRRGRALREFIFADVELAYQANNISLLSSHLMKNPNGFTLRRASTTDDADLLFMANEGGTMTVFCTLRTQEVNAMTMWHTAGEYEDVCSILDDVYYATSRTINGELRSFLEVMDPTLSLDCAVVGGTAAAVSVPHLAGETVGVNLDGFIQQDIDADVAGLVTFAREAETSYAVGLNWPEVLPEEYPGLRWLVKTLPIEASLPDGTMMGRKRRIVSLSTRLRETNGLIINGNRMTFQEFGDALLDQPPPEFTGVMHLRGLLGWDYDGAVVLGDDRATKATILGLAWAVSI